MDAIKSSSEVHKVDEQWTASLSALLYNIAEDEYLISTTSSSFARFRGPGPSGWIWLNFVTQLLWTIVLNLLVKVFACGNFVPKRGISLRYRLSGLKHSHANASYFIWFNCVNCVRRRRTQSESCVGCPVLYRQKNSRFSVIVDVKLAPPPPPRRFLQGPTLGQKLVWTLASLSWRPGTKRSI